MSEHRSPDILGGREEWEDGRRAEREERGRLGREKGGVKTVGKERERERRERERR